MNAFDASVRNLRYTLRALARTPGFTVTVVLTLAIGLGANSAVFSALDAVLLRPLAYRDADRLVSVREIEQNAIDSNTAPIRLEEWNGLNTTFDSLTGFYTEDVSETSGDLPEKLRRATVSPRFLATLGVAPMLGRDFESAEQHGVPAPVVLISERFWRTRFNADPAALGREIRIGSIAARIVGVLPSALRVPDRSVDLWRPASVDDPYGQQRQAGWYTTVGRLASGVSLEQAQANLAAVQAGLAERFPEVDSKITVELVPLKDTLVGGASRSLWLLFGAASAVLLIACANVATLLLARAGRRKREIAVRLSLGASARSIVGQQLVETAVLASAGAALGLVLAATTGRALRFFAADLPRVEEVALNGRVLGFAIAAVVVTTILAGLLPGLRAARGAAGDALGGAGRGQVSSRQATQWWLVGTQVALCVALLACAGLLLRSVRELALVDPGFQPSRVLAFRISTNYAETGNRAGLAKRIEGAVEALAALPGVDAASVSQAIPGVPGRNDFEFAATGGGLTVDSVTTAQNIVSPSYFATLGIPLLAGELCANSVDFGAGNILVNRRFVDAYLPGAAAAAGVELRAITQGGATGRVVGVVGDSRDGGIDTAPRPTVYLCSTMQFPPTFLVRTRGDPLALAAAIRTRLKELEPLRSVYDIAPLDDRIDAAFGENNLRTALLALFAAAALALACVGIYGTLSYVVGLGRREVGLRLALGARPSVIVRQFLGTALKTVAMACAVGAALALATTRGLAGMLYGVSPSDPLTLFVVIGVVVGVAALAAIVPALRASRIDPMEALREE